jgi:hypothetical protein
MPVQPPPPPRMTGDPRPSPSAWRGPAAQVQRPPPPPPPRRSCGFCGRVRAWLVTKVRPR